MFDILKFLDDAPLKLTSGAGSPDTGGCWMSALSLYSGDTWSDHPDCVDPMIRSLCVLINDSLSSDAVRGRIISPHILEPVGTKTIDHEIFCQRFEYLKNAIVREIIPFVLYKTGHYREGLSMRLCEKDKEIDTLVAIKFDGESKEMTILRVMRMNCIRGLLANDFGQLVNTLSYCCSVLWERWRVGSVRDGNILLDKFIEEEILPIVLGLCAIGSKAPVEMACDEIGFRRAVQCAL
jgi:hypothetical protein